MVDVTIQDFNSFQSPQVQQDLAAIYAAVFPENKLPDLTKLEAYTHKIILLAYAKGQVVGFKVGYVLSKSPYTLYSWAGGVLPAYQNQGIATKLLKMQHEKAKQAGLKFIETSCLISNKPMLKINQTHGLKVIDIYVAKSGKEKRRLHKVLG